MAKTEKTINGIEYIRELIKEAQKFDSNSSMYVDDIIKNNILNINKKIKDENIDLDELLKLIDINIIYHH